MKALLFAFLLAPTLAQTEANFTRIYKAGEKTVYSIAQTDKSMSLTANVEITVNKLIDKGAELKLHLSSIEAKGAGAPSASPDVTLKTVANNMPETFTPTMGGADFLDFFVIVAGSTVDKKAKAGDEFAWKWSGGVLGVEAKTKAVQLDKKVVAEIKAKVSLQGKPAFEMSFTSTYDPADCRLAKSEGRVNLIEAEGIGWDLKIARKPVEL